MGLVKKLALAMALLGTSTLGSNTLAEEKVLGNEYMHGKIEQYFEKNPEKKLYLEDGSLFLRIKDRNVEKFKEITQKEWTPETLSEFMLKNQEFISDMSDSHSGPQFIESPLEFYLSGDGDCDDFANFADYILS